MLLSNLMAILLQMLAVKLGIVTGRDLAQACRDHYSRPVSTRLIAIVTAVIVTAVHGERWVGTLLILSQVILSLQLSFAVVPLVRFTGDRRKMGTFTNGPVLRAFAWSVATVIIGLNGWLLVGAAREGLA